MNPSNEFTSLSTLVASINVPSLIDSSLISFKGVPSFSIHCTDLHIELSQKPFVTCDLPPSCPGILTVHIIALESVEIHEFEISELIRSWNVKKKPQRFFSFSVLPIELRYSSENSGEDEESVYKCNLVKAHYFIDEAATLDFLKSQKDILENDISIAISKKCSTFPLIATVDLSTDEKILRLRKEVIKESHDIFKKTPCHLLEELQRFLLATDKEFIRLRTLEHLTRIVRTHFWLRRNIISQTVDSSPSFQRSILIRAFPGVLKYPFGERHFLSLGICISRIDEYEQLKAPHILEAFRSIIPEAIQVPQSFYSYTYSQDRACTLYIELEKGDASVYTHEEMEIIRKELPHALANAIEPLVSKIDIPQNEEEHLRNILLLSQELKSRKEPPQVIIQFAKQQTSSLEFRVTLMKIGKEGETIHIDQVSFPPPTEILQFIPVSASTISLLRGKYPKQAISFVIQCSKKPFSRPNKSIDYVRAREFIVTAVESVFGPVRDVNGGLIWKQNQFISEIAEKLAPHERRERQSLEDLFLNMSPPLMRSLLSPEVILNLFKFYNNMPTPLYEMRLVDSSEDRHIEDFHALSFTTKSRSIEHELLQKFSALRIPEHDIALTYIQKNETVFHCFLLLRKTIPVDIYHDIFRFIHYKMEKKYLNQIQRKSIRISLPRPTLLLDPRVGTDRTSGIVIKMLYEGLMRLNPEGKPSNALAESIDISLGGTRYTFRLRESVWSNKKPVTAYDFEYAWKKILDPSFKTLFDYLFHPIKNAKLVKAGIKPIDDLGVRAVSPYELVVDLEMPTPYFLELCCHWIYSPLSKEVDEMHPGWAYYAEDTYVCNGPFRLTKWRRDSEIQAVKNENYWDKDAVALEKIDISIIEDPKVALSLFEDNKLDWIGEPLTEIPLDIIRSKRREVLSHPISSVQWFALNVKHKPFQSKKVRHAFSMALDRKAIVETILRGDEALSSSLLPKSLSQLSKAPRSLFNLEEARRLFLEGLNEQGLTPSSLPPLSLRIYDQEPHKSIAYAVQEMWEKAFDISIIVEVSSWHKYFESIPEFSYDIIGIMWYSWFLDPMYTFETLSSLSNGMNLSQWQNPHFLRLFHRAQKETSPEARKKLFTQLEDIVMDEMPVVSVFEYTLRYMKNRRLNNIYLSHLGNIDFKWADLSES